MRERCSKMLAIIAAACLAGVCLSGCVRTGMGDDLMSLECSITGCPPRPGPAISTMVFPAFLSNDGGEITVPFVCRPPKKTTDEMRAIAYTVATGAWRPVAFPDLKISEYRKRPAPIVPEEGSTRPSCAADCSKFVYIDRIDRKDPHYFPEIFHSDNGKVRQLTNFHIQGAAIAMATLSADGRKAVVYYIGKIALVDVDSGKFTPIPFREQAWADCTTRADPFSD